MADIPEIYRIILQVSDLDAATEFYSKLLGIEGRNMRGARTYFDCGQVILALVDVTTGGEEAMPLPDNIYFSVSDLTGVYERAKDLNCLSNEDVHGAAAGEIVTRPWGERSFYVKDPFGNGLCFVDGTTQFTGR
jgi:catechol 2,3-dioxygenase-like lactoylglutathione lyase family enzyme